MLNRNALRVLLIVVGLLLLAGCTNGPQLQDQAEAPTVLTPSPTWQQSVDQATYDERVDALTQALERLREETGSGWVGRQDDLTGYVGQLRGGSFAADGSAPEAAAAFLDAYGADLLGVEAAEVALSDAPADATDAVTLRGIQNVGGVPVVDGELAITVSDSETAPRVTLVSGRVFPGITSETEPTLTPRQARRAAERSVAAGFGEDGEPGTAQGVPELVVLPVRDAAALAWEVTVVGGGAEGPGSISVVFVDALDGTILETRPGQLGFHEGDALPAAASLYQAGPPQGDPAPVRGRGPSGDELTGTGLATPEGVELRDTTTPTYDPATGRGGVETYDATGLDDSSVQNLPGKTVRSADGTINDADAIAAHVFSRYVYDYFGQVFGRSSWDGAGGSLISAVNFGPADYCNAFFSSELSPPQMVYGDSCDLGEGPLATTFVDIDIAGHEVTHGVIDTSGGLLYTGQSGALNESFADYFGNVIGNAFQGTDNAALGEGGCVGIPEATDACSATPDGLATRYMLTGSTFDDYLSLLDPPTAYRILQITQDNGGVHSNSGIWNNATWTIRTRLAQIDNLPANESPRARAFDQVMYAALTRYLTPTSGFLDARVAVEQAATDLAVEPVIADTIREVMDLNRICAGCQGATGAPGLPVTATAATQKLPQVAGDRVAWVDGGEALGQILSTAPGAAPATVTDPDVASSVAFAGDAVVTMESGPNDEVLTVRRVGQEPPQTLTTQDPQLLVSLFSGVAGSPEGAAWLNLQENAIAFVDPAGTVSQETIPIEGLEDFGTAVPEFLPYFTLGTGGGTVAVGSVNGAIITWDVGSDPKILTTLDEPVLSVATNGTSVLALTGSYDPQRDRTRPNGRALLIDIATGQIRPLSDQSAGFGAALSDQYAVWPQIVGRLGGGIAEGMNEERAQRLYDTDLHAMSLASGQIYSLLPQRGQQAFPALSGNRLVWQEAGGGGDDIYTAVIPEGL